MIKCTCRGLFLTPTRDILIRRCNWISLKLLRDLGTCLNYLSCLICHLDMKSWIWIFIELGNLVMEEKALKWWLPIGKLFYRLMCLSVRTFFMIFSISFPVPNSIILLIYILLYNTKTTSSLLDIYIIIFLWTAF